MLLARRRHSDVIIIEYGVIIFRKCSLQLKSLEEEKDKILTANCSMAQENIDKEPEIVERKSRLNALSEEAKELCSVVQEKLNSISEYIGFVRNSCIILTFVSSAESKTSDNTPETVLALLQASAAESEESSDKLVTSLTNKEKTVEEFVDEFLAARKTMHLRKLKADKMVELLQQQKNGNSGGGHGPMGSTPYPSSFYGTPGSVPYPTGPYQMPMPGMPGMMYRHFWNGCTTQRPTEIRKQRNSENTI